MADNVTTEIRYQVGEAWKGEYNNHTVYNVAAVVQDATGLSIYRSLKSGNVGHPLSNTTWWFKIIDLSGIKTESDRIAALNTALAQEEQQRVTAEQGRVAAEAGRVAAESDRASEETTRVSKENQRQSAESSRISNENTRNTKESQRQSAETTRANAETARAAAETLRDQAESTRATNENSRVAAEQERVAQAASDHSTASTDHTTAAADHTQACTDHTTAAADHTQAGTDHSTAVADHTAAAADHTQAGTDHSTASSDHTTAAADHTQAASDHSTAGADHTQAESDHTRAEADHDSIASKANVCENAVEGNLPMVKGDGNTEDSGIAAGDVALKNGAYDSLHAGNLTGWSSRQANVNSVMSEIVRTTAGDESVDSSKGAALLSIVPKSGDFKATSFVTSGFNLLNGNYATQIGSSGVWYFVVPQLSYGLINTSSVNNGVLFTSKDGEPLTPTVYLKSMSEGVPSSATDGVAASYTDAGGFRFYTTPAGLTGKACYMIVSGITRDDVCAHIGWSGNYAKYVSPNNAGDGGTVISMSGWLSALHATEQQALWLSPVVCDRLDRLSGTSYMWTRMVGITTPVWTTVEDEVEEGEQQTYTHTAIVSGMLPNGLAALYDASNPAGTPVSVTGTEIAVHNTSQTPPDGKVKYQLATTTTGTITIGSLAIEDWGLEAFVGAVGEVEATLVYSQGFPDAVAGIVLSRMGDAEDELMMLAKAYERQLPDDGDTEGLPMLCGQPYKLYGDGSPAEATVPSNWKQLAEGGYNWNGLPSAIGQEYIDTTNGKKYEAVWNNYAQRTLKWLAV